MPTLRELADEYVDRLRRASNEHAEIRVIAVEIEGLVYVSSRKPISTADKNRIVDLMAAEFPRPNATSGDVVALLKEADNKRYLLLVQSLKTLLAG